MYKHITPNTIYYYSHTFSLMIYTFSNHVHGWLGVSLYTTILCTVGHFQYIIILIWYQCHSIYCHIIIIFNISMGMCQVGMLQIRFHIYNKKLLLIRQGLSWPHLWLYQPDKTPCSLHQAWGGTPIHEGGREISPDWPFFGTFLSCWVSFSIPGRSHWRPFSAGEISLSLSYLVPEIIELNLVNVCSKISQKCKIW